MGSAELATIDLPTSNAVVFGNTLTLDAGDALGPSGVLEELKAGIFVGELGVELFDSVLLHGTIVTGKVRVVKG